MGMTMTQKILASAAGLDEVHAGQLIMANLDMVLANDITGPVSINEMVKFDKKGVFDKDKPKRLHYDMRRGKISKFPFYEKEGKNNKRCVNRDNEYTLRNSSA